GSDTLGEADFQDHDTLDFSGFSQGASVSLNTIGAQTVSSTMWYRKGVGWVSLSNLNLTFMNGDLTAYSNVGIENVIGSDFNDSTEGNSRNNRIEGRGEDDYLRGLTGDDTYVFSGLYLGSDTVDEQESGGGTDTLDFSNYQEGIKVNLSST